MKEYFKDRKIFYPAIILALLVVLMTIAISIHSSAGRDLDRLRSQHKEMILLKDEFVSLRARIDAVERKKGLTKVNGIVSAVDEVFSSLGMKNKIKSIKPLGTREASGFTEEDAEVSAEKVSMNEMVNLLYKIENAPMLLVLRKTDIKTSFERPELLNLTLMISLIHEK